ncbi:MAG: DUF3137 domain-containing protein [Bacilli bacterium]|nr:DUF3137 domain-containing protein [Bacilli bacterium]
MDKRDDLIKKNKKINIQYILMWTVMFILFFSPFILMIINAIFKTNIQYPNFIAYFVTYGIGVVLFFCILSMMDDKSKEIKDTIVKELLEKEFGNNVFRHDDNLIEDMELYLNTKKFVFHFNIINDYFKGKYNNKTIEIYDVFYFDNSDQNFPSEFTGQWLVFDFYKEIKSEIYVCDKRMRAIGEKYKIEDASFMENFNISGSDEQEVFYVLTPTVIEQIKRIKNRAKCPICVIFESDKMHVLLKSSNNLFNLNKIHNNSETAIKELSDQISFIKSISDEIEDNKELFKNE